ncbi:hypothetical protein LDB30_00765 [Acidithiobacillus ferrooxidans]|nr:hypothetical protein LDB30_00765 [Acidithiobacillus ferrooxidans]
MTIVDNGLIIRITDIFSEYRKRRKRRKFLAKNRRDIKILVDATWDQIIANVFSQRARNHEDALRIINSNHITGQSNDNLILTLRHLLEGYSILESKEYIDSRPELEDFFMGRLRPLLLEILHNDNISIAIGQQRVQSMIDMLDTL